MLRRVVIALLPLACVASGLSAQEKPNFSGTWKLNVAKSDFGVVPPPESRTDIIEHNDPAIKWTVSSVQPQGKLEYVIDATTDGKKTAFKIGPRDVKLTAAWDGPALMVNSTLSLNENDVTLRMAVNLSGDGQTLTENIHVTSAMGEMDQKLVYEKQSSDTTAKAVEPAKPLETAKSIGAPTAGPRPNLTGVWKLNTAKSDFGVLPPPESRICTIDHADPNLKLTVTETGPQARNYTVNVVTDGSQADPNVVARWDGSALVSTIKLKYQEQDITVKRVSTLSADGKVLTNKDHLVSAMGEMDMTEVYEKQ